MLRSPAPSSRTRLLKRGGKAAVEKKVAEIREQVRADEPLPAQMYPSSNKKC
jgi:hypothetical protein